MPYHFAAPEHDQTDEEKKLEILKYPTMDAGWLTRCTKKQLTLM